MSFLDSLGRGAAQGSTFGLSDEAVAKILAGLPGPSAEQDGGIPREYAAGSPEQDYLASERGDNQRAAQASPVAYGAGELAGGLPSALAGPAGAGGSAVARVASAGLTGGALGGLSGAGHANGRNIGNEIGKGAMLGGALGTGGGAILEGLPFAQQALAHVGQPQLATDGAPVFGGAQLNQANSVSVPPPSRPAMLPPRPNTADMPRQTFVPKSDRPLVPEHAINEAEDLADASMIANSAKAEGGTGVTPSQIDSLNRTQRAFNAKSSPRPVRPIEQTEQSTKATVPPKRRQKAYRDAVLDELDGK